MILKNKIINIHKELIKSKKFVKKEIKSMILKSIIQNSNVAPLIRIKASRLNCKKPQTSCISKQKNNICIKTGRYKGVYKQYNLTRHYIKFLGSNNNLQNTKIASW